MKRAVPYLLVFFGAIVVSLLLPAPERHQAADAGEIARTAGIRVLGATRGYAVTALWLRAGESYSRGELYETLATYELIRELQPRNPAVFSYLSWNQAYNISAQFPDRERREEWVVRGLRTLHEGQDRLPEDASLRVDEYHFLLNRCAEYPSAVLEVEAGRLGGDAPVWGRITERAVELREELSGQHSDELDEFLDEIGLGVDLFDVANQFFRLPEDDRARLLEPGFTPRTTHERELDELFPGYERTRLAALLALSDETRTVLALSHWCRLHAMMLVLKPALALRPHPLAVDEGALAASRLAWDTLPPFDDLPDAVREDFRSEYKEVVAKAFLSGIENAQRIGGADAAVEFIESMQFNFEGRPELLPPDLMDRALQEIQE